MLAAVVRQEPRAQADGTPARSRRLPRVLQLRSGPHRAVHTRTYTGRGHRSPQDEAEVMAMCRYISEAVHARTSRGQQLASVEGGDVGETFPAALSLTCEPPRPATARSAGPRGSVQAHGAGHALEVNRADLPEGDVRPARGVDDFLTDEHLARSGVVGDPRGDV